MVANLNKDLFKYFAAYIRNQAASFKDLWGSVDCLGLAFVSTAAAIIIEADSFARSLQLLRSSLPEEAFLKPEG